MHIHITHDDVRSCCCCCFFDPRTYVPECRQTQQIICIIWMVFSCRIHVHVLFTFCFVRSFFVCVLSLRCSCESKVCIYLVYHVKVVERQRKFHFVIRTENRLNKNEERKITTMAGEWERERGWRQWQWWQHTHEKKITETHSEQCRQIVWFSAMLIRWCVNFR